MRRRKRYLDNTAPADNTANVVRPVNRMIQVKQQDTPARREKETREYQAKVQTGQRILNRFSRTPAGRRAANRAYAVESQKAKQEAAKEEAAAVVGSLFKPLMPSTYVDMAAAIKNGQVNNLTDALAAPYLSNSWSIRNPGKALVTDIVAPFALSKGTQLAKFAGRDIANSWRDMRYALAHPESQVYGITAGSPYSIETLPGFHIGSLQRGNVLEKQLSKAGTISLKSVQAIIDNPNTARVDKYILKQVLNKHGDNKVIDYNTLRREAQELVPKYTRVPQTKFEDYGAIKLGLTSNKSIDEPYLAETIPKKYWDELKDFNPNDPLAFGEIDARELYLYDHPEVYDKFKKMLLAKKPDYNTFSFESPGFIGDTKHYSGHPLGHTRSYIASDEPNVLHIMESQSDWAQRHKGFTTRTWLTTDEAHDHIINTMNRLLGKKYPEDVSKYAKALKEQGQVSSVFDFSEDFIREASALSDKILRTPTYPVVSRLNRLRGENAIEKRLVDTYLQRQLQENMLYGAERGKSLMRYPTPETAAKIESYPRGTLTPEYKKLEEEYNDVVSRISNNLFVKGYKDTPEGIKNYGLLHSLTNKMRGLKETNSHLTYAPNHQTILKKYADFPKMFNSLFKGQQVRNVTDKLGNTWYEVDIPSNMLKRELKFKLGGRVGHGLYRNRIY